jgi:predicted transcriptional regulator
MSTTSLKLPDALKERLTSVVTKTEQSAHAFMVQAIEEAVEAAEDEQAWEQELERRYRKFRKTGMAITEADMRAYVAALARGERPPRPKLTKISKG